MKKRIALLLAAIVLACTLTGCREAEKVNYNMSVAADNFSCERRITVYNARTDKIVLLSQRLYTLRGRGHHRHARRPIPLCD